MKETIFLIAIPLLFEVCRPYYYLVRIIRNNANWIRKCKYTPIYTDSCPNIIIDTIRATTRGVGGWEREAQHQPKI